MEQKKDNICSVCSSSSLSVQHFGSEKDSFLIKEKNICNEYLLSREDDVYLFHLPPEPLSSVTIGLKFSFVHNHYQQLLGRLTGH